MGLEEDLAHFHGTEHWYRNFTGLLYTDGVQYLAEKAKAYWLIDLVGSYQPTHRHVPFQFWELDVQLEERKGVIKMSEDLGAPILVSQEIPYTDFPLKEIKLYCIDNVLLLPSEY